MWHLQQGAKGFCRPCSMYTSVALQAHELKAPEFPGEAVWGSGQQPGAGSAAVGLPSVLLPLVGWIFMCTTTPHCHLHTFIEGGNLRMFGSSYSC